MKLDADEKEILDSAILARPTAIGSALCRRRRHQSIKIGIVLKSGAGGMDRT